VLLCLAVATAGSWFLYQKNNLDLSGKVWKVAVMGIDGISFSFPLYHYLFIAGSIDENMDQAYRKTFYYPFR
jgi:hypothetical protein